MNDYAVFVFVNHAAAVVCTEVAHNSEEYCANT